MLMLMGLMLGGGYQQTVDYQPTKPEPRKSPFKSVIGENGNPFYFCDGIPIDRELAIEYPSECVLVYAMNEKNAIRKYNNYLRLQIENAV